jgi:glycerol-3-phosphate acyltransferase PlsX
MGGDFGPSVVVEGALMAVDAIDRLHVILVGDRQAVDGALAAHNAVDHPSISVVHAEETIGMDESPAQALRQKKKSSIHVGVKLVKERAADAFVSAGNTGAVMAVASVLLRTIEGIDRAGIAAPLPKPDGGLMVLLDAGANVSVKPHNLYQFGVMGAMYARYMLKIAAPRVGLLSIGEEETKGNDTIREAHEIMAKSSMNFIGNLEAKLLYKGVVDVVVCDGFTGNIALKVSESVAMMITGFLKDIFGGSWRGKLAYLLLKDDLNAMKKRIDHAEVGGAPLIGIDGAVFISHGSSDARAIRYTLAAAKTFIDNDVNGHIREVVEANRDQLDAKKAVASGGVWDKVLGMIGLSDEKKKEDDR